MSSRSNGVMYCVLSSWIRSCVIASPAVSIALTSAWLTDELGILAEALLGEARRLERVRAGAREEVVELRRLGRERQPHCGAMLPVNGR